MKNMKKPKKKKENTQFLKALVLWIVLGLVFLAFLNMIQLSEKKEEIDYTQLLEQVKKGEVAKVVIRGKEIRGKLVSGEQFKILMLEGDTKLIDALVEHKVSIVTKPEETLWMRLLFSVLPVALLIFVLWFLVFRPMQATGNQARSFGMSRAKMITQDRPQTTFDDVAGVDEAKEELQEIIEFLKNPAKFQKLGGKIPRGLILVGEPGTGKTLLAKAIAGEAKVPFFAISGSDFVEMFVGVGAARVRDLFGQAKKSSPCLVFIDEIDAVGRQRFAGLGGGHDEREQTLNQLLAEMDGFDPNTGVILLAATNRPDVLDPALLRPGRFDRRIVVDRPDIKGREAILKVHTRKVKLEKEVSLEYIARQTPGFTGADLANLVNEAALLAARRDKKAVGKTELEEAIDRVIAGPERKSRLISDYEKKLVAYHEAGHALLAHLLPFADPVHKVSIIPRGINSLGYTMQLPLEDRYIMTKKEIMEKVTVFLGGRVAENLYFQEDTTGAKNDLKVATEMVQKMVTEYGMSEKLGPITLGKRDEQVFLGRDLVKERDFSESIASKIDEEVRRIVDECFRKAEDLLKENKGKLGSLAKTLLAEEVLDSKQIEKIIGKPKLVSPEAETKVKKVKAE